MKVFRYNTLNFELRDSKLYFTTSILTFWV
jgi:hypothetical protein